MISLNDAIVTHFDPVTTEPIRHQLIRHGQPVADILHRCDEQVIAELRREIYDSAEFSNPLDPGLPPVDCHDKQPAIVPLVHGGGVHVEATREAVDDCVGMWLAIALSAMVILGGIYGIWPAIKAFFS